MEKMIRPMPLTDEKDASGKRISFSENKRINHRDHFELSYLRWRYFMRTENPDPALIKRYTPLIKKLSKQAFNRFRPLFQSTGMEEEDLFSVGQVQLVSYLGLFSIEHNPKNFKKFEEETIKKTGQAPTTQEIKDKDLANMAAFISQRFNDVARVCYQKNKRVMGEQFTFAMFVLVGPEEKKCSDYELMQDPASAGYRRLTQEEMISVKRARKRKMTSSERFEHEGKIYRLVYETTPRVNLECIEGYEDILELNPQDTIDSIEKSEKLIIRNRVERLADKFKALPKKRKIKVLTRLIKILESKPGSLSELKLANEILEKLR